MSAEKIIEELKKRFNPQAAKDVSATFMFSVKGDSGAKQWFTKINNGTCEFIEVNGGQPPVQPDCTISVNADDLDMILSGRMSAMTAALSGVLSIDGELGLAMQLVPIFFGQQASLF